LTPLPPTAIHIVSYQCNAIRPNRIVGRFREPPARQRLINTTVVCAIRSGYGQHLKAAPLQGADRIGLASEAALHGFAFSERKHQPRIHVGRIIHLQILVNTIVIEVSTQRFSRLRLHGGKRQ